MEALRASYGETSSDSDTEPDPAHLPEPAHLPDPAQSPLPPPPISLLQPPNSLGTFDFSTQSSQSSRVRTFPHVEGNYALHVYIPVTIPLAPRKELALFLKRVAALVPELHVVDIDVPLIGLVKDGEKFEHVALGKVFHVSLGRTVPIRVHQRDSVVGMLRQRLQSHKRYWIDFSKWEVFVNDDCTRTFLSMEVTAGGLAEIRKQIEAVNEVYKLHNLPEFYTNPRPHISIAWAVGDISNHLKRVITDEMKRHENIRGASQRRNFTCLFTGVSCKIGQKTFEVCKVQEE